MIRFILCVAVLPVLMGLPFMRLKKEKETITLTHCYMMGLLFLFLLGEIVSCAAVKMELGFTDYCKALGIAVIVFGLFSAVTSRKPAGDLWRSIRGRFGQELYKRKSVNRERVELVMLFVLCIILFAGYFLYVPQPGGDTTAETISVTVTTDTIFRYNPVTGQVLRYGMYPIYKFASLPILYSALSLLCGMPRYVFVYFAVPIWIAFVSFAVLAEWGRTFFREQKEKMLLFFIFTALLIVVGDGEKSSFAYRLLHEGWTGPTAAAALIVPFGACIVYQTVIGKEWVYGAAGVMLSVCGIIAARPMFLPDSFVFSESDSGRLWGMLLLAVLALYLARDKTNKKWRREEIVFLSTCLLLGIISGNALVPIAVAYAGTCLWAIAEEWKRGTAVFAGFTVLICMTGTVLPFQADIPKRWHISEADKEIQDKIAALADNEGRGLMLAGPETVMEQARLRSDKIVLPYGKDLWQQGCNREIADVYTEEELMLYEQMKIDYLQPDTVAALAAGAHCDILVMRETMSEEAGMRYGWEETERTTGYVVYCR